MNKEIEEERKRLIEKSFLTVQIIHEATNQRFGNARKERHDRFQ